MPLAVISATAIPTMTCHASLLHGTKAVGGGAEALSDRPQENYSFISLRGPEANVLTAKRPTFTVTGPEACLNSSQTQKTTASSAHWPRGLVCTLSAQRLNPLELGFPCQKFQQSKQMN
jgi:hypothetical protein